MVRQFSNLITLPKFIEHKIASSETDAVTAVLKEYLMAGNGLFTRAKRREFTACLPLCRKTIIGLPDVQEGIIWHKPRISTLLWELILRHARANSDPDNFREDVYVVYWNETTTSWLWKPVSRERRAAATIADDRFSEYGEACLELHTHPPGAIHFSRADDHDESDKFRIFGILVDIHSPIPQIRFRCGVYDLFAQIPAAWVGEMPEEVVDLNAIDLALKKIMP